jgi:hypothetical protein
MKHKDNSFLLLDLIEDDLSSRNSTQQTLISGFTFSLRIQLKFIYNLAAPT